MRIRMKRGGCGVPVKAGAAVRYVLRTPASGAFECPDGLARELIAAGAAESAEPAAPLPESTVKDAARDTARAGRKPRPRAGGSAVKDAALDDDGPPVLGAADPLGRSEG